MKIIKRKKAKMGLIFWIGILCLTFGFPLIVFSFSTGITFGMIGTLMILSQYYKLNSQSTSKEKAE